MPLRAIWILLGAVCLLWGAAETCRGICFAEKNPWSGILLLSIHMSASILLLITGLLYVKNRFKKWSTLQLLLGAVTISVCTTGLLCTLFLYKGGSLPAMSFPEALLSVADLFADITLFAGIAIWYFSIRGMKISIYPIAVSTGMLLFAIADICGFCQSLNAPHFASSVIDLLYMASTLMLAAGAGFRQQMPDIQEGNNAVVGIRREGFLLLLFPVFILVTNGPALVELMIYLLIIVIHDHISNYIQVSIKNERLLEKEKSLNSELEKRIAERTKELVEKNTQLAFLSDRDEVTNLYNRRYFINALNKRFRKIASDETLALLYIDVDRFKIINDTYGHQTGDRILFALARNLERNKPDNAFLARFGEDEFVFAFEGRYGYSDVEKLVQPIIAGCNEEICIEQYAFHLTVSAGISIYPLDAQDGDALLKNADMAMYLAKKQGYNRCNTFSEKIRNTIQRKNETEFLLRKADYTKELVLYYQPQFSIPERRLIGMEALLRWNSPEKGLVLPGDFIPIAEETDLIVPIGKWVTEEAIRQIHKWNDIYGCGLTMSINVSPKQLRRGDFVSGIQTAMSTYGVQPECLDFEITESVALDEENGVLQIIGKLKSLGVSISIDDFGMGHSSLHSLILFPFDRIKIAKQWIDNLNTDQYSLQIAKSVVYLAQSIGMETIAEGVETQQQLDLLEHFGCGQIQGFLLGRPVPPQEFEKTFLAQSPFREAAAARQIREDGDAQKRPEMWK